MHWGTWSIFPVDMGVGDYRIFIHIPSYSLRGSWSHPNVCGELNFCTGSLVTSSKTTSHKAWGRDQRILMMPSLDWDHGALNKPAAQPVILGLAFFQIEFPQTACNSHSVNQTHKFKIYGRQRALNASKDPLGLHFEGRSGKIYIFFKERSKVCLSGQVFSSSHMSQWKPT